MKTLKKTISLIVVLAMAFTLSLSVLAGEVVTGDTVAATIKGVTVENLGTNDNDLTAVTPGTVTLTAVQAADIDGTLPTAFEFADETGTVVKKFAEGVTIDDAAFLATDAYDNEAVTDGDVFVVAVTTAISTGYYKIVATVTPAGANDGSEPTGDVTITGDGVMNYINMEIFDITLPTDKSLGYQIDPQGLLSIADGETEEVADLVGGSIIADGTAKIHNNSSIPVTVDVSLTATGDATFLGYGADDEATLASVDDGAAENILLYAVPASVDMPTPATEYVASGNGYVVEKDAPTVLNFVLDAANYAVTNTAGAYSAAVVPNTGSGAGIQMGGRVSTEANWLAYEGDSPSKTVGVKAVYHYEAATDVEIATETVTGVFGLITTGLDMMTLTPDEIPVGFVDSENPLVLTIPVSEIPGTGELVIDFNFGDLTFVSAKTASGTVVPVADCVADEEEGTITYSVARTAIFKGLTTDTYQIITLSDESEYRVNFDAA